jgi:hypothetical protein
MLLNTVLPLALLGTAVQALRTQIPLASNVLAHTDAPLNLETPFHIMNLSSVQSEESFTALSHPQFPNHGVRIKKSNFCDPTVS